MPLDSLPGQLIVPTRAQQIQWFLRDWTLRNPLARVDPGGEPYLRAQVYVDQAVALYSNAVQIAKNTSRATMTGTALDNEAKALGTQRFGAIGASGAMVVTTSAGGATIYQNDVVVIGSSTYQCTQTALYVTGAAVPVIGIATGPGTNQDPGTVGQWQIPRPGCAQACTVATQVNGSGLSGGMSIETDDQLRQRLNFLAANPPASGNDGEIELIAGKCPVLSVQQPFTFPCVQGPSSTSVVFTLRATQAGGNRIPNPEQLALMLAWLQGPGQLPADITLTVASLVSSPTNVVLRPVWALTVPAWVDTSPWPAWTSVGNEPQIATPSTSAMTATNFRIVNAANTPSIGQNIALFDLPNLKFRRKKILTVSPDPTSGYDITVDTTNSVSDTSYTPLAGQFVCPWSDSLDTLTPAVVAYFDTLGPGEMVPPAQQVDPGSRMRRIPRSPALYPSQINVRMLAGPSNQPFVPYGAAPPQPVPALASLPSLLDVAIQEPVLPLQAPVGAAGVSAYLLTLGGLAAYP